MKPISVILSDSDWLVVDKPHGLSIHNNEDPENLMKVLTKQLRLKTLLPVHRLDKETSGIQIFALNKKSAQELSIEFQTEGVGKHYIGLVKGLLKKKKGLWESKLTDKAEGRKVPQGLSKNRVPCTTGYNVIRESPLLSLCEFQLFTGRQHQIRKHTAVAKHPLVGDPRYGSKPLNSKMSQLYGGDRMYLHCNSIEIMGHTLKSKSLPNFDIFFEDKNK